MPSHPEVDKHDQTKYVEAIGSSDNLHAINQAILKGEPVEKITSIVFDKIRHLITNCHGSIIFHFDYETALADVLDTDFDFDQDIWDGKSFRLNAFPRRRLEKGQAVLAKDLRRLINLSPLDKSFLDQDIFSYIQCPLISQEKLFGVLIIFSEEAHNFESGQSQQVNELASSLSVAIMQDLLQREAEQGWERLHRLSEHMVKMQENERRHIARELHDEIGQALTGLKITLEMNHAAQRIEGNNDLQFAQESIKDLISRVQELSLDLRPGMLDDLGLLPALMWYVDRYTSQTGVNVHFQHQDIQQRFPQDLETAAYRIVQECLTNVARHTNVKEVHVQLVLDNEILVILVEDQGDGFSYQKTMATGEAVGLIGMRERALNLGGELKLISAPGTGTQVLAKLPINKGISIRDSVYG